MTSSYSIRGCSARRIAATFAGLALVVAANPASASTFNIGPEIVVRHLQDVRLQNGSGEPLYLGYKLTYHWFGLPYGVTGGGYVFAVKDKPIQYDLEEARVAEWQAQGHVPSPLPVYRLSATDYVLGYLLWIVTGILGMWYGGKALLSRRSAKRVAPVVDEAAKAAAAAMAQRTAQVARVQQAKPAVAARTAAATQGSPPNAQPVPALVPPAAQSQQQSRERPKVQPQIQTLKQPQKQASSLPMTQQASSLSQTMVTAMRLPVARTLCRVKALKVA